MKVVGKVFSYQNILLLCCFDFIMLFLFFIYVFFKEVDGFLVCVMEYLIKSCKEVVIIYVVQSKDMKGKIFWIKLFLECNRKGKMQ